MEILDAGLLTTVQDGGRRGWARFGVPPSGPLDAVAFRAANLLVGNAPGAAALEITLTGPVLRLSRESLIAICGATFDVWAGRLPVPTWHAVYVRAGQYVTFGQCRDGARAYLAISGGIALAPFLGSQSTYLKGGFGGLEGRALRPGDRLPLGPQPVREPVMAAGKTWPPEWRPPYSHNPTLRIVWGPQDTASDDVARAALTGEAYRVTPEADRMGMRLEGPALVCQTAGESVSDGLVTGSIQVPPNGRPIVMLADHQTTGGYPKIATVIQADLPLLAQCLPGASIHFKAVSLDEARQAYLDTFRR
ncbi:MAG: biotin-dependent carboxyltransferase family protein [Anaerolineae bacterium]|nr:biotin-dependent carboxyltransferase family protein [Anaerolineae bacterium]